MLSMYDKVVMILKVLEEINMPLSELVSCAVAGLTENDIDCTPESVDHCYKLYKLECDLKTAEKAY